MVRKVAAEAPARPEAASAANFQLPTDARDVERLGAARESRMRIRCAVGAEGARRISSSLHLSLFLHLT
jgi:hypothetical protein